MKPAAPKIIATPTGILLAAGKGSRFDPSGIRNKLLAPLRQGSEAGLPVAFVAARRMRTVLSRVVAVIDAQSPQREALTDWLKRAGCDVIETPNAAEGMGANLAFAIRAVLAGQASPSPAPTLPGWVIGLADMPMIAPATLQQVIAAMTEPESIAAPVFQGRRGHPVGIGAAHTNALLALSGDEGARELIEAHGFTAIETGDEGVVRDIDSEDDLNPNVI